MCRLGRQIVSSSDKSFWQHHPPYVPDIHTANPHLKFAIARQVPFGIEGFFLLPIPEFSGMGSNFFQSRVGEAPSFQSKKSINRIREFLWSFLACLQKKQYADFYTVIDMFRSF